MILPEKVKLIHQQIIEKYGGSSGIRDTNALQSAINRPFQTFDNKELYNTVFEKAAALLESILKNHPFIDGNKRTGYVLLRLFLMQHNFDIHATEDEKFNFIINIASGNFFYADILNWLKLQVKQATF